MNIKDIDNILVEKYYSWEKTKTIKTTSYEKMFLEVEKLIKFLKVNNNINLFFKKKEDVEKKKYSSSFLDLFIRLGA